MKNNSIELSSASFDKFSKRLYQEIEKESELSLSKTKEIASKSLGFRNYNNLKEHFKTNANLNEQVLDNIKNKEKSENKNFLKKFSNENLISIASILMKSDDMWAERGLLLLKTVLELLDILKLEKNADNILKYIYFDNLFECLKKTSNQEVKKLILKYFNILPGFNEHGTNVVASEQNSYLSIQLVPIMEFLKNIEKKDFLMFSLSWITSVEKNQSLNMSLLKELISMNPGHLYATKSWKNFFFDKMKFSKELLNSESFQDSWISDEAFVSFVTSKIITLKTEEFYFSDFLYNISKIINIEKKKIYNALLENMKHNYESCIDYSNDLKAIANKNI